MILAVDDIPQNVRLLQAVLEPRGYAVAAASSGEEALSRLAGGDVDLVLLGIVMPGMDGYEVCRRLRAAGHTRTRVIALTGYGQDKDKQLALDAGFDEHTVKPVEFTRLVKLLSAES